MKDLQILQNLFKEAIEKLNSFVSSYENKIATNEARVYKIDDGVEYINEVEKFKLTSTLWFLSDYCYNNSSIVVNEKAYIAYCQIMVICNTDFPVCQKVLSALNEILYLSKNILNSLNYNHD